MIKKKGLSKRTENQVNKVLQELNLLHDQIVNTYEEWDLDWYLLQVENAKISLINLLENGKE